MSSFSPGGFYVSGSSETLVEVSNHKYIVHSSDNQKVAFTIHFFVSADRHGICDILCICVE